VSVSPALAALFNNFVAGNGLIYAWRLYTITLSSGLVLRYADSDFDINAVSTSPSPTPVNGFTYSSAGPRVDQKSSKTMVHLVTGLDKDTYVLVVVPRPFDAVTGAAFPDTIGNVPFLQACGGGALDAADFQVDEAYFAALPSWPMPPAGAQPIDCKTIFAGVVAQVDITNTLAAISVDDYRSLLSILMPRRFYQAQCTHLLFGTDCNADGNMNAATFQVPGIAAAGSTQSVITSIGLPRPPGSGTYALGRIVMTSGLNATFQRQIKSWDGAGTLSLSYAFPFAIAAGDTFLAYPGCDKSFATCGLFNNQNNYGGTPFVPPPEVLA
jgi:hypothetical protein